MKPVTLMLPYPPSNNRIWQIAGRRMIRTKHYREWLDEAALMLRKQNHTTFGIPVSVEMRIGRPDRRKRDVHNLPKPVLDLLEHADILADDHLVHRLNVWWDTSGEVTGVEVNIVPMGCQG